MHKKLLSNLPFNPSLIHQVAFYAKRLHKETAIRRTGFAFMALTLLVQMFAFVSPAQAGQSCDPSNNDIIHCGFKTKEEAVNKCKNNSQKFGSLLNYYKVTCDSLSAATTQSISSTSYNNKLISVGRKAFSKPGERPVSIPNAGNFYWRPLSSWDSAGPSTYKVLVTHTSDNQMLMVMFECGNLVTLKDFNVTQPQPDSQLTLVKQNQPTGDVKPGDTINYTLIFANRGGTAAYFSVQDSLPSQLTYQNSQYADWIFENKAPSLKWYNNTPPFYTFGNTDAFGTPGIIKLQAKVNSGVPSGTTVCNQAWLEDVNIQTKQTRQTSKVQVCNTVRITCPTGQVLNNAGTECETVAVATVVCESLSISNEIDRTKRVFEAKAEALNGASIKSYTYDFGDRSAPVTNKTSSSTNTVEHKYSQPGNYDASVSVDSSLGKISSANCKVRVVIDKPIGNPLLSISKKAKNITAKKDDANGTTASAGDVIEYSLTTVNYGDADSKDTTLQPEDLQDILEYSNLDMNTLQGGVFDSNNKTIAWNEKVTIKAGGSVTKTFRVKVKDPIPTNPKSTTLSNRSSFDMVMTNVYGNVINIKLPETPSKTTETVTTALPKTGPGTGLALSIGLTIIVGYFFARSRLLAKEFDIVKTDFVSTGGGV